MEKINVFDVQVPDGRQIRCMSYNKVTYFDLDDICKLCFDSYDLRGWSLLDYDRWRKAVVS